jgi:uncharacterized protein
MTTTTLQTMGDESFVSLTTFRSSGKPVSTPVWIGRDEADVVMLTPLDTGKVKRLRANPQAELRPCDRRGRVQQGAPALSTVIQILEDPAEVERVRGVMRRKYGIEYRLFMIIEALVRRTLRTDRVGLRLGRVI